MTNNKISSMGYLIFGVIIFILAVIIAWVLFFAYPNNYPTGLLVSGIIAILFAIAFYFTFAFLNYGSISKGGTIFFFVVGMGFLYLSTIFSSVNNTDKFGYIIVLTVVLLVFLVLGSWRLNVTKKDEARVSTRHRVP